MRRLLILITLLFYGFPSSAQLQGDSVFVYFAGQQTSDGILLAFTVKGGVTCQGVKIMHSTDLQNFEEVYEFQGVCGNPTFDESYVWTHDSPENNSINYYRIEVSSLGITSKTLSVLYIGYNTDGFNIFPNPCKGSCTLYFSNSNNEIHNYEVFDTMGKLILKGETRENSIPIKAEKFTPGVFSITVSRNNSPRFTGSFMVIR